MEFDEGGIFYSDQQRGDADQQDDTSPLAARIKYREFIRTFRDGETFVYRDKLRQAVSLNASVLEVDLDHVMAWDDALADDLLQRPAFHLPLFEGAALEAALSMAIVDDASHDLPAFQITLTSSKQPTTIRQLLSSQVSRVVMIPGIVISSSKVKAKATTVVAQCKGCHATKMISVRAGFAGANLPRKCDEPRQPGEAPCPVDPYSIVPEKCKYVDMQTWKLQESPEMVPTGEMPRSVLLSIDRHLVDKAIPGNRVTITGIMNIMQNAGKGGSGGVAIRTPYLQVLGVKHGFDATDTTGASLQSFTAAEEEEFRELARGDDIFERVCTSIAPSIYGSDEVKKAVACLLFGGSRKELPDGARLRGDINVLLLGDPSVAKSQFLKFVEKAAPIAVYTSGKGSSAAGLTATVTQDPASREFYLEGGAMVLADGGVVCIDEFDKMREQDRVAIHEAMEQQTISVAKAGITTVLNSRTSVLAAANPTFGRYDAEKNAAEQVDFQSTILSRFDMIFILRDEYDLEKDRILAAHILKIHVQGTSTIREPNDAEIDVPLLKRYIAYARSKCSPRLTEAAMETLQNYYVQIRQGLVEEDAESERRGRAPRAVPITVRQLEAIIRISESAAKMRLSDIATDDDVQTAIHMFTVSTLRAAKMGDIELEGDAGGAERTAEEMIRKRVQIYMVVPKQRLLSDLSAQGIDMAVAQRALNAMVRQREFEEVAQGKKVKRLR
jgi:DNA replication licensing factor MCM5